MRRCEEEREYLKKQQAEVEHKLEVVCKTEADAKAEAKHAQLRYEDREHELNERAALLRRQEAELVSKLTWGHSFLISLERKEKRSLHYAVIIRQPHMAAALNQYKSAAITAV